MTKKLLAAALIITSLSACQSTNPYTREEQFNKTSKYAVGGAVVGAVAGQVIGKDTEGTLKGAAAGTALGAGLGYYFDRQEAALRQELERTGVSLRRTAENTLELVMPGNLTFRSGSADINSEFYDVLDSVAKILVEYKNTTIFVSGHTDNTGSLAVNQRLSKDRANSVGRYLSSRGVLSSRISSQGFDYQFPIASNSTASGREQNRRVEIEITGGTK
ncbi:OmpA family protein [uncultured Ilyobacter sp.]|uniref:OmpA family protein n=1 Tax=uncultured Ilyobacter sp. TaxID=544433 RepID=UPI0029C7C87C|nr:OmpA family protein [uncultured Ilyobacter sp.]